MRSNESSGSVGTTSAALPYSCRMSPEKSAALCGFMRHISVIAGSSSTVVTSPPRSRAIDAVYANPVQMSSTLAPLRMGATAAILRAVSSSGRRPRRSGAC